MIDKTYFVKKNKMLTYITYAVVLAFILFNYETVFSTIGYLLSLATPVYIAAIIAFILNIPMKKIEKLYSHKIKQKKLRRALALATTLILTFLLIILFSSFIIPRLGESIALIITNIFNYTSRLVSMINDIFTKLHINYTINYETIQQALASLDLNRLLSTNDGNITTVSLRLLFQSFGIFSIFVTAITSFIMSLYLLANKETHIRQIKKIVTFIFGYKRALVIFDIGTEANHYFNGFVSGQLLESCILMCLMYFGFRITSMPFPELLAFIIGFSSLVPMFGGFVGFGVSFILVLAVEPSVALIFAICFIIIQQFESNVLYPRVVGNAVGISGLYVLFALVVF